MVGKVKIGLEGNPDAEITISVDGEIIDVVALIKRNNRLLIDRSEARAELVRYRDELGILFKSYNNCLKEIQSLKKKTRELLSDFEYEKANRLKFENLVEEQKGKAG